MIYDQDDRPRLLAVYMLEHRATVRSAAAAFGVSKSTVHKDVTARLPHLDPALSAAVGELLAANKSERHLRGGAATKLKYQIAKRTKSKR